MELVLAINQGLAWKSTDDEAAALERTCMSPQCKSEFHLQ